MYGGFNMTLDKSQPSLLVESFCRYSNIIINNHKQNVEEILDLVGLVTSPLMSSFNILSNREEVRKPNLTNLN